MKLAIFLVLAAILAMGSAKPESIELPMDTINPRMMNDIFGDNMLTLVFKMVSGGSLPSEMYFLLSKLFSNDGNGGKLDLFGVLQKLYGPEVPEGGVEGPLQSIVNFITSNREDGGVMNIVASPVKLLQFVMATIGSPMK